MRVLITGGGTGGHVYPGITLAQTIQSILPGTEILFVGTTGGLEADVVPREGFRLETIALAGLPRRPSLRVFPVLWLAARGLCEALRIIGRFRPDVAVGTGGYVCGPVILAAALRGVPCAIQEQNAFPGLTTRLLGRLAKRVFLAYEDAAAHFAPAKVMVTGNPIRQAITAVSRAEGAKRLGLDPDLTTLLVVGASQGARSINEALLPSLPNLLRLPRLQVLHITGKRNFEAVREAMAHLNLPSSMVARVHTVPYLYNIADAYAAADLVISRAGAIGLAEMTARGLPLVLVPFPHAAADHQTYNARALERRGAARVIPDGELRSERLLAEIMPLVRNPAALSRMARASKEAGRPEAARLIAGEILRLTGWSEPMPLPDATADQR